MFGAVLTEEQQQAAARAQQDEINRELTYREVELARWTIIFTSAVGAVALVGAGLATWHWRKHRGA